ncbi:MAG TPA: alpha/beta hydrolase, partial [Nevskiaceae bacterium]|nr:alpha/beta hydrolase [Nevskiaceae bacterium]
GRRLAWREYGERTGRPCIYTAGTPASGLCGAVFHEAALRAGVRWVAPDKPGSGHSDFMPRRRLLDWADDVAQLADHLRLTRFAVAGESGGGPHTLALAARLPQRVTVAVCVAGMGQGDSPELRRAMTLQFRTMLWLAAHAPWLPGFLMGRMVAAVADPQRRAALLQRQMKLAPAADAAAFARHPEKLEQVLLAYVDAFRGGTRGPVQEFALFTRPWEFEPAAIEAPVHLWHGEEDRNVPVSAARRLAAMIPGCTAHYITGAGHGLWDQIDAIVQTVATAA